MLGMCIPWFICMKFNTLSDMTYAGQSTLNFKKLLKYRRFFYIFKIFSIFTNFCKTKEKFWQVLISLESHWGLTCLLKERKQVKTPSLHQWGTYAGSKLQWNLGEGPFRINVKFIFLTCQRKGSIDISHHKTLYIRNRYLSIYDLPLHTEENNTIKRKVWKNQAILKKNARKNF